MSALVLALLVALAFPELCLIFGAMYGTVATSRRTQIEAFLGKKRERNQ